MNWWVFVKCKPKSSQLKEPKTSVCVHWIYLIHEFHNLSWITEENELFHDILIYIYIKAFKTCWKACDGTITVCHWAAQLICHSSHRWESANNYCSQTTDPLLNKTVPTIPHVGWHLMKHPLLCCLTHEETHSADPCSLRPQVWE